MSDSNGDEQLDPPVDPVKTTQYLQIIAHIFFRHYSNGDVEVPWKREDIVDAAAALGLPRPKNLGDVPYTFRYRAYLPENVRSKAPAGRDWIIRGGGKGRYKFVAVPFAYITPTPGMAETKIPDSTPGIIAKYALGDEQALLAKLRYNRLVDVFSGVTCYPLQSHLRTSVKGMGQVETDEIYIGVDRRGIHYTFPVQAKGGNDILNVVQIEQDFAMSKFKFPALLCRPIAAQFISRDLIALFDFEQVAGEVRIASEKHYRLVPHENINDADLRLYLSRP